MMKLTSSSGAVSTSKQIIHQSEKDKRIVRQFRLDYKQFLN